MERVTVYILTQTIADLPADESWLSSGERIHVASLRFPKRRKDWVLGRWTAKRAIRSFLALNSRAAPEYTEIDISSATDGAPAVTLGGSPASVALSLSHSAEKGMCVVGPLHLALGCDLELVQQRDFEFVKDYFCAEERSALELRPVWQQPLMATLIWSAKESALKCLRAGLRRDTRSVAVDILREQGQGWNPLAVRCLESSKLFYGWWRTVDDFVQTVAADAPINEPADLSA